MGQHTLKFILREDKEKHKTKTIDEAEHRQQNMNGPLSTDGEKRTISNHVRLQTIHHFVVLSPSLCLPVTPSCAINRLVFDRVMIKFQHTMRDQKANDP